MDLAVIIVSYNVKDFLDQALSSIQKALLNISAQIWVVDNASTDGTVGFIEKEYPDVKVIANEVNLGFAKANNLVLRKIKARYFCLINPDTIVQEDTFSTVLEYFEQNQDAGMVGCKILNPDGSLQLACRRSFPTPWIAFTKIIGLSRLFPGSRTFGRYNLTYLDPEISYEVEAISGSFMVIRRRVVEEVGMLDEDFFLYGEDLDWCYRISKSGWKIIYLPTTQIIHFKGESSRRSGFDSMRLFYQAMHLFVRKHFKNKYFFLPGWILLLAIWARASVSFLGGIIKNLSAPLFDLAIMSISLIIAVYMRFGNFEYIDSFVSVNIFYTLIWLLCLVAMGCYSQHRYSSSRAGMAVLLGFMINSALTFFFKQYGFSRAVVLYSGGINILAISGWRVLVKFSHRFGLGPFKGTFGRTLLRRRTLIVGDIDSASELLSRLNGQIDLGYEVVGILNLETGNISAADINGIPVFYSKAQIGEIFTTQKVQEVIFSSDQVAYDQILSLLSMDRKKGISFKLVPSNLEVIIGKASVDRIEDIPLIDVAYKLHKKGHKLVKRSFDIVFSALGLLAMFPALLYTVLVERKPLVTRRVAGSNGAVLYVKEFAPSRSPCSSGNSSSMAIGWRRAIPRLWSVLRGDLSFVGVEMREPNECETTPVPTELKPGLFGINQLRGGVESTRGTGEQQLLYYLKNYSVLLDIEIILKGLTE